MATKGEEQCRARLQEGRTCTRPKDCDGRHVAHEPDGSVYLRWMDDVAQRDVVEEDVLATIAFAESGKATVKVASPALILKTDSEDFLRDVVRMTGGDGQTVVCYVVLDGRHIRVEVRDLDGPTVAPPVFYGPHNPPPPAAGPDLSGLSLASQDPGMAALPVNSIGTCKRCGYHGPGPRHACNPQDPGKAVG